MAGIGFSSPSGAGVKHARSEPTSIAGTSAADIAVTWGAAFPDTNYTAVVSVQGPNTNTTLPTWRTKNKTASAVTCRINNPNVTAEDFTVHAMGVAD